eukprot:2662028-Prymnesium_polylepis.1
MAEQSGATQMRPRRRQSYQSIRTSGRGASISDGESTPERSAPARISAPPRMCGETLRADVHGAELTPRRRRLSKMLVAKAKQLSSGITFPPIGLPQMTRSFGGRVVATPPRAKPSSCGSTPGADFDAPHRTAPPTPSTGEPAERERPRSSSAASLLPLSRVSSNEGLPFRPMPEGKSPAAAIAVVAHFQCSKRTAHAAEWFSKFEPFDWTVQDAAGAESPAGLRDMQQKFGLYCIAPSTLRREGVLLENMICCTLPRLEPHFAVGG